MSEQTSDVAPHTPHSRHSAELRERAFELHCQFQSNHAIALALDVPERTVRSWIREILDETTKNLRERRVEFLQEAVVSQRAIAAAAWNVFTLTLDHERARLTSDAPSPAPPSRVGKGVGGLGSETTTIYRSARLLQVAFAAQREIAHLLRLYDNDVVPKVINEIIITRNPPWPEPDSDDDIPGSPDDPNSNDRPRDDNTAGDKTHADPYAGTGLPADLIPVPGVNSWRQLHGYPQRSQADSSSPTPEGQQLSSPPRVGEGPGERLSSENPATPATASTSAETASPEDAIPPSLPPAPPSGGPGDRQPERPDYPIAWLFPPGAPIPRPYRNAPPRPDIGFFNNPLRW